MRPSPVPAPGPSPSAPPILRLEIEIEAQDRLLWLGARRGWTEAELRVCLGNPEGATDLPRQTLNEIRQAREVWLAEQRRLLEAQR